MLVVDVQCSMDKCFMFNNLIRNIKKIQKRFKHIQNTISISFKKQQDVLKKTVMFRVVQNSSPKLGMIHDLNLQILEPEKVAPLGSFSLVESLETPNIRPPGRAPEK